MARTIPFSMQGTASPPQGRIVRHFTPNWFAATMGTGILAIALAQFPAWPVLFAAGRALWLANIGLFALFTLLYAARWLLYPAEAARIFGHSTVSMFFGCIPMGLATILNGILIFALPEFGPRAVSLAFGLWGVDVVLAVLCGLAVPFLMFTRQSHAVEKMSAVWLLPVVACEVASVSGGLLLPHLGAGAALGTLLLSLILWACSVPLALGILVILFLRMAVHKLPPVGLAASSWLALGPIGTGALSLFVLYPNVPSVLEQAGLGAVGPGLAAAGLLGGILLWGYGLWWMAMAVMITLRYRHAGGIPFNMGWWGYIFPLGVYTVATLKLAAIWPIAMLGAFGGGLAAVLTLLWAVIGWRTLRGALDRSLFVSPCLSED